MTSVPNHLLQLSGNSFYITLLSILLCVSCGTTGKLSNETGNATAESNLPQVYNPETGRYEPVEDPVTLVDTVDWVEVQEHEPIGSSNVVRAGKKDLYKVAFMLPLHAAQHQVLSSDLDPKTRRFLNCYGGIRLGLKQLEEQGIHIETQIFDTNESPAVVARLLKDLRDIDLIVGPYQREALREAAGFAARYKIPVISPWTPSITLDYPNAHFIQMVPGLRTHAEATMTYIGQRFFDPKLFIVARNDREKARFQNYHEAHSRNNPGLGQIEELMIEDISIDLKETDLDILLPDGRTTVFILPYYSRNDEDFLNGFLRKLHAEKLKRDVVVFGLPQWANFRRLNPDYLESLNVHITMAQYSDLSDPATRDFAQAFFDEYGTIPEPAAKQGYDLVRYFGEALDKHGLQFVEASVAEAGTSQYGAINLNAVFEKDARPDGEYPVLYYENQGITILNFSSQAFHKVDSP